MKLVMCCVRDAKMEEFGRPFFAPTRGVAQRNFTDEVKRADSEMARHPEDYDLWYICDFDTQTGVLEVMKKELMVRASDLISREN